MLSLRWQKKARRHFRTATIGTHMAALWTWLIVTQGCSPEQVPRFVRDNQGRFVAQLNGYKESSGGSSRATRPLTVLNWKAR